MKGKMAFTLTELIVAVAIFALTLLALFATYETFYRSSKQQIARTATSDKLRPAVEQLERFISDAGFGISKDDLENNNLNRSSMPPCDQNIDSKEIGGLTACIDNDGLESETNRDEYNYPLQLFSKSVVGNNPYSGNYFVYDDKIDGTSNIENYLIDLFGLPSSNFRTVVLDLNKNALQKNQLISELSIDNLINGNIILIGRIIDEQNNEENVEAYYYLKRIELSQTLDNNKYSICNPNTRNIQITNINPDNNVDSFTNPIIPCVAYFNTDFGCYDNKKIKWQRNICEKVKDIKLVRIGLIVQSGFINKELQYHGDKPTLTFPSLGKTDTNNTAVEYTLIKDDNNIKNDQRYYKWEIIERIISTPNLNY